MLPETVNLSILLPAFSEIRTLSNGLYKDTPATLNVRGMAVKELKQLTSNKALTANAFDAIVRNCIKEPININDLLIQDYNNILLNIRLQTNGPKASATIKCGNCGNDHRFDYDLAEAVIATYATAPVDETKSIELPRLSAAFNSAIFVEVKQLTRGDYVKIENIMRTAKEEASRTGIPMTRFPFTELIKAHIKSVQGLPAGIPLDQLVDHFLPDEAELIAKAFDNNEIALSGEVETTCPFCGRLIPYSIPFSDLFF